MKAGLLRIALCLLGLSATVTVDSLRPYVPLLLGYLALALLFQWLIYRRLVRTATRAVLMGTVDLLVVSVLVQRLGSVSTVLPLAFVVAPGLYATTTGRRRVSVALAIVGVVLYATMIALESAGVLPYAPNVPGTAMPDAATRITSVLFVAMCSLGNAFLTSQLISALGAANRRLRDLSQHDELTGLYNRRLVMQRLSDELARQKRKREPLTVAMVDLDGFKRVNDEEGHDVGDDVLKAVATALLSATRRADVVARYGGDEFVIVFPNTETEGARTVAMRVLDMTREAARRVCPAIPVSASIGTTSVQPNDDPGDVIRRIDEQLYAAKRAGGDRISSG